MGKIEEKTGEMKLGGGTMDHIPVAYQGSWEIKKAPPPSTRKEHR